LVSPGHDSIERKRALRRYKAAAAKEIFTAAYRLHHAVFEAAFIIERHTVW
jgi:hypothetical protein